MNPEASVIVPRRRRLPTWGWWSLLALLVAAGFFGFLWNVHERTAAKLRQAIAELSAKEPGWTLAELETARTQEDIPDEQNSALAILALDQRVRGDWQEQKLWNITMGLPPNQKFDTATAQEIAKIAANVEFARKLNDLPRGRFSGIWTADGWSMDSPIKHRRVLAKAVFVLKWDSLQLCQAGKYDLAMRNCVGMINAGNSFANPSNLGMNSAYGALERILGHGEPSDACLLDLQKAIQALLARPLVLDWLIRERAMLHECIREASEGTWHHDEFPEGLCSASSHLIVLRTWSEMVAIARRNPESPYIPLRDYLASLGIKSGTAPEDFDGPALAAVNRESRKFLGSTLDTLRLFNEGHAHTRAGAMCANIAIAAERFRQKEKSWPTGPEQLVPAYLPEWPLDPFDNQPMRYKVHSNGRVSIYFGSKDYGGKIRRANTGAAGTNIGMELFPLNERGLEPEDDP